jgi:hypothetical protein
MRFLRNLPWRYSLDQTKQGITSALGCRNPSGLSHLLKRRSDTDITREVMARLATARAATLCMVIAYVHTP